MDRRCRRTTPASWLDFFGGIDDNVVQALGGGSYSVQRLSGFAMIAGKKSVAAILEAHL
jgi:hypothetical protein